MPRISRRYPTLATLLKEGQILAGGFAEAGDDFPNLQIPRERLEESLERLREMSVQVAALQAQKQMLVQEMYGLQEDTGRLMAFLHLAVKERYGSGSEKLAMFGMRPFRGRKKSAKRPEVSGASSENPGASEG